MDVEVGGKDENMEVIREGEYREEGREKQERKRVLSIGNDLQKRQDSY